jgi:hypothetical protein
LAVTEQDDTISVKPVLGLPYKIGDIVNHKHYGKCKIQQVNCFDSHAWYAVTNNDSPEWFFTKEEKLTLAEPTIDETPKFKVGDRVLLDNYYDCIVDDYIYEIKSYKVSIMGGGYNIAKEVRLSHRK